LDACKAGTYLSACDDIQRTEEKVMHVVLGANGRAGGETARALLERGEAVRVVLRRPEQGARWAALGAEVVVADIRDAAALAAALQGASGAFLLNPTPTSGDPYAHAEEIGTALADALRRAGTPKAVVLSAIGAQHATGTGVVATLNRIEALLEGAAPAIAFLRPGYFVETWSEVAEVAMAEGVLPTFLAPTQRIPMVSTVDVGRAAAALLGEAWDGPRVVQLCGPEDWSAAEVAAAFGEVLGRPVTPVFVPPEARAAVLAGQGVDDTAAAALLGMYEGIAAGRLVPDERREQRRGETGLIASVARIVSALPGASQSAAPVEPAPVRQDRPVDNLPVNTLV
jgi:uncharacterized protein YbjT (DUF2867 family)